MKNLKIQGRELLNSNGQVDPNSVGFQWLMTTMTFLIKKVIEQKFFEFDIAGFVPVDVGTGAWMGEIAQPREFYSGGSFYEGDINDQAGRGRLAEASASVSPIRMPTRNWAKKVGWNIFELAEAANSATGWDVQTAVLKALKKNWDLGIQEQAMLGHPVIGEMSGLLNAPEVSIDSALITTPLKDMTEVQFDAFIAGVLNVYYANSGSTTFPKKFIIPTSDYLGLGVKLPGSMGNITKLQYLLDMFRKMTRNESFDILPMNYAEADKMALRGVNASRYVLYNDDPETVKFHIPVDFSIIPGKISDDNITYVATAYGQYSGVMVARPREVMYFDAAQ